MQYTIRSATVEDLELLDRIHRENMRGYVAKVYPWNPTLFRDNFTPQDYRVIEERQTIAGFFKVVSSETDIYLGELQIIGERQNQGIGTGIIKSLIAEAKLKQKRLWLKVIKGNPAEKLYRRLRFTVFKESATHKMMNTQFYSRF